MNQIEKNKYHETKSHSSEEFLFNTYPCSIPTDFPSVPLHWHNDMELIVIKHGSAKVTLNLTPHQLPQVIFWWFSLKIFILLIAPSVTD